MPALQRGPQRRVGDIGRGHPDATRGILDGEVHAVGHGQSDHAPNTDLRPLAPQGRHAREHTGDVGRPNSRIILRRNARDGNAGCGQQQRKQHPMSPAAVHAVSPTHLEGQARHASSWGRTRLHYGATRRRGQTRGHGPRLRQGDDDALCPEPESSTFRAEPLAQPWLTVFRDARCPT